MLAMRGMELRSRRTGSVNTIVGNFINANIPIANGSFESDVISTNSFQYVNAVTGWNRIYNNTVILNGNNDFGIPTPYPNGAQAFGSQVGSPQTNPMMLTQSVSIPNNCRWIRVSCSAALGNSYPLVVFIRFYLNNLIIAELPVTSSPTIGWRSLLGSWFSIQNIPVQTLGFSVFTYSPIGLVEIFIDNIALEGAFQ
jgi:hypothetical protein